MASLMGLLQEDVMKRLLWIYGQDEKVKHLVSIKSLALEPLSTMCLKRDGVMT